MKGSIAQEGRMLKDHLMWAWPLLFLHLGKLCDWNMEEQRINNLKGKNMMYLLISKFLVQEYRL